MSLGTMRRFLSPGTLLACYLALLLFRFSPFPDAIDDLGAFDHARAVLTGQPIAGAVPGALPAAPETPALLLLLTMLPAAGSLNPALARVLFAALFILTVLTLFHRFRTTLGDTVWMLVIPLAVSGMFIDLGMTLNGEVPAMLAGVAALQLLDRKGSGEHGPWFWLTIAISVAPLHFSVSGLAFSAAWIFVNLRERRYRHALAHLGLALVTAALYRSVIGAGSPFPAVVLQKVPSEFRYGYLSPSLFWGRFAEGLRFFFGYLLDNLLLPSRHQVLPLKFASFLLLIVAVGGLLRNVFLPRRFWSVQCMLTSALIVMHPDKIAAERLFFALVPGLMLGLVTGMYTIAEFALSRPESSSGIARVFSRALPAALPANAREAIWIAVVSVSLLNGIHLLRQLDGRRRPAVSARSVHACAQWLRENTPPGVTIMSHHPELLSKLTRRRAVRYPDVPAPDALPRAVQLSGATHLVIDGHNKPAAARVYALATPYRHVLPAVYVAPDSGFTVLGVTAR